MEKLLDDITYTYNNVLKINLKQKNSIIPVDDIIEGVWKIHGIMNQKKLSGVYFYNPLYISQVYSNEALKIKGNDLNVSINTNKITLENEKSFNELKIYDNGFILDKNPTIYVSSFLGKLTGFMMIIK